MLNQDSICMDNFQINVIAEGKAALKHCYDIANLAHGGKDRQPKAYALHEKFGFIGFWFVDPKRTQTVRWPVPTEENPYQSEYAELEIVEFPNLSYVEVTPFDVLWGWLKQASPEDFPFPEGEDRWGNRIDTDGSCDPTAFHFYNQDWGHVGQNSYAYFAVRPCYAWCGK
jgi:hypothetical protein